MAESGGQRWIDLARYPIAAGRNLIAVAADIAWRAAQLNPHYGGDAAERATGLVLVDEVDLHLHPAWQRRAIRDLRTTFPGLQLVVTTHSPQVISTVAREHIRVLDGTDEVHLVRLIDYRHSMRGQRRP